VIRKVLEAFFRHKLMLLLPPFLIPGIVTPLAVLANPPVFETAVSVWVDHPAYLNYKDDTTNAWVTGVQTQASRLGELLRTRAFVTSVAGRTSLAPLVGSPIGEARLNDLIARGVTVGAPAPTTGPVTAALTGDHLLVIRVQASTAQLSYELCKAIVDVYQEKTEADQSDQASVAADFYQARLTEAQSQMNKATSDLRRYVSTRQTDSADGSLTDPTQQGLTAAMLDPRLGALQDTVQASQSAVKTAQAALAQAQQEAMMSAQGRQYGFQVLDPPQFPTVATPQTKKIMIYPIAAAVAGIGLMGLLLALLVASDRSVRSDVDLAPGLRLLGTVPLLQVKRVPKSLRDGATRRAIGAAAGTALPAPSGANR
jgi:uncharacterized protein involved in exopolysaccharide biosynthesis